MTVFGYLGLYHRARRVLVWLRNPHDLQAREDALEALDEEMQRMTPSDVVDRLLALHFLAGYRRVLGVACLALAALDVGAIHVLGGQIPFVDQHLQLLTTLGGYLTTIGWLLRGHALPGGK